MASVKTGKSRNRRRSMGPGSFTSAFRAIHRHATRKHVHNDEQQNTPKQSPKSHSSENNDGTVGFLSLLDKNDNSPVPTIKKIRSNELIDKRPLNSSGTVGFLACLEEGDEEEAPVIQKITKRHEEQFNTSQGGAAGFLQYLDDEPGDEVVEITKVKKRDAQEGTVGFLSLIESSDIIDSKPRDSLDVTPTQARKSRSRSHGAVKKVSGSRTPDSGRRKRKKKKSKGTKSKTRRSRGDSESVSASDSFSAVAE
mmetsp:Transcript_10103/g.11204  ORF Transcript_10103/g.11204 Transcript_10103/m.11204 type:complete len:253 (+) Transcript_10103:56-814(+)|eukprot:CAMPEP_0168525284 /NCGR_PEP_ID=MMETSP0405-20121227/11202_1 /TAXON_ID=498012 /ORGANISM="Trichosphaerium sp, Strain Am-I-7 wt" /LENGTH=252 /DNA_ID=CAMNT_0008547749 /DNA_START=49 /DNA_END=807 /DNA_ORIENTATION=+